MGFLCISICVSPTTFSAASYASNMAYSADWVFEGVCVFSFWNSNMFFFWKFNIWHLWRSNFVVHYFYCLFLIVFYYLFGDFLSWMKIFWNFIYENYVKSELNVDFLREDLCLFLMGSRRFYFKLNSWFEVSWTIQVMWIQATNSFESHLWSLSFMGLGYKTS